MATLARLLDALLAPDAYAALRSLDREGALTALLPELEEARGFAQPEKHYFDVLDHSFAAVAAMQAVTGAGAGADGAELRAVLAWIDMDASLDRSVDGLPMTALLHLSALLHDVAKPRSAATIDGQLRFPRHGPLGAEILRERLPAAGLGPEATDFVARMVRYHLRPGELIKSYPPTDRAVRRFVNDLDGHILPLMLVNLADGMATRGPGYTRENFRRHCGFVNYVVARSWAAFEAEDAAVPPLITGEDLLTELDLESGRLLGAVLTSVRRAQEAGAVTTRDAALTLAHETLANLRAAAN